MCTILPKYQQKAKKDQTQPLFDVESIENNQEQIVEINILI